MIAQPVSLVNSTTAGDQQLRAIGAFSEGGYGVVWVSGGALYMQRYDSAGNKIGGEIPIPLAIDPRDTASQILASSSIAVLADGSVLVAYAARRSSGGVTEPVQTENAVYVQRFDVNGVQTLPETRAVSLFDGDPRRPTTFQKLQVLPMADGGYVVGWDSFSTSATVGSRESFFTQRFDASNQRVGGVVNIGSVVGPSFFRIVADASGGYTAYWSGLHEDFSPTGLTVKHYDENQSATQILSGWLGSALLLPLAGDGFVLYTIDTNGSVQRQMLDRTGAPVGQGTAVSVMPVDAQQLADGSYVVFWSATSGGLTAQRFTADGEPIGDLLALQTSGTTRPVVPLANGGFVVAWNSLSESTGLDVYTQRFIDVLTRDQAALRAKRKDCLVSAKGLGGHERKAFMEACLSN